MKARIIILLLISSVFSAFLYPQSGFEALSALNSSDGNIPAQTSAFAPGSFFYESFEGSVFPPANWTTVNVEGRLVWNRYTSMGYTGSCSARLLPETFDGLGVDWLIMPRVSVTSGDSLTFMMRPISPNTWWLPETLYVKVSFDPEIPSSPSDVEASFTETILTIPISDNTLNKTWYRKSISLDAFAGKEIYIGFKDYNENSGGVYIEDVCFGKQKNIDLNVYSVESFPLIEKNQTIHPTAVLQNLGSTAQNVSVTMEISPSGYISQKSGDILPLTTIEFPFDDWTPDSSGKYTISVHVDVSGDEDMSNNINTGEIGVLKEMSWSKWHSEISMPERRAYHGAVSYNKRSLVRGIPDTGFVCVIGGSPFSVINNSIYKYNTLSRKWVSVKPLPEEFNSISSVQVKGKIYMPGGKNRDVLTSSLYIYDITTGALTKGADIPIPVAYYSTGTYGDSLIYVFGGLKDLTANTKTEVLNTVQIYNVNNNSWSAGTQMPEFGGWAMAGGIAGDKIALIGSGQNGLSAVSSQSSDQVFFGEINPADPYIINWTLGKFPGGAISYAAGGAVYDRDKKYVFMTGGTTGSGYPASTWAYNFNDNLWERGPDKISPGYYPSQFAPVVRNDSVFMVTTGGIKTDWLTVNEWLYVGPYNPFEKIDAAAVSVDYDTVMINKPFTPKATFTNIGNTTGSVVVKMEIKPGSYVSIDTIDALAYNDFVQTSFADWTPKSAGKHTAKIYADNLDDKNLVNDTLTSFIFVDKLGIDVAPYSADFDTVYALLGNVPKATFINNDILTQTFPVGIEITPGGYTGVDTVESLPYNGTEQISFGSWVPSAAGTYKVKIFTSLPEDENPGNDTLTINLTVLNPKVDVASVSIDFDTLVVGSPFVPIATFTNLELSAKTFAVTLEISPGSYKNMRPVISLPFNDQRQISFAPWTPAAVGTYKVKIYTYAPNDRNLHNDTLIANIVVTKKGIDAASVSIDFDTAYVDKEFIPKATFTNKDKLTQTFITTMVINPGGYMSVDTVKSLPYNADKQTSFAKWVPATEGTYSVKIYTSLPGDEDLSNDTLTSQVIVKKIPKDAASISIDFDTVSVKTPYVPQAEFANLEQFPQDVIVAMEINPGSYKSVDTIPALTYNVNRQVSFQTWTPAAIGNYTVKIYTSLPGDENLSNDTLTASVYVKELGIDVAPFSIDLDTVYTNLECVPAATFTNKDKLTQTFAVTMEINPGEYVSSDTVKNLGYNQKKQVSFSTWTPNAAGIYTVKAYTYLPGDEDITNDTIISQIVVKNIAVDAASFSIDFDTVLVNTEYVPKAAFTNLELFPQDVIVTMEINPGGYKSVDTIPSLAYNVKEQVSFAGWTPASVGTYTAKIYTYVPGDEDLSNDTLTANIVVKNLGIDAAAFSIDFDTVLVNMEYIPKASFTNKQVTALNVIVALEIMPGGYISVDTIPSLAYDAVEQVSFAGWIPASIGTYTAKIYTSLPGDEDLSNDTLTSQVIVKKIAIDAASFSIDFDTVFVNTECVPKATFANMEQVPQDVIVTMEINPGNYKSIDTIRSLAYNVKEQVSFAGWTPASVGIYTAKIYTYVPGDEDLSNDTLTANIVVKNLGIDAAVFSIDFDTVKVNKSFVPKVTYTNKQLDVQGIAVTLEITPGGYASSDTIHTLKHGAERQVTFKPWTPPSVGLYTVKAYLSLSGDEDLTNDTLTSHITARDLQRDAASVSVDFDTVIVNKKFIPKAAFINKRLAVQSVIVMMEIDPGNYKSADTIPSLAYNAKRQISFAAWTPDSAGEFSVKIYTCLSGDEDLSNDTLSAQVTVKNIERDVASFSVDFDTIIVNKKYVPKASFINKQPGPQTFTTAMKITPSGYLRAGIVESLPYNSVKQISFGAWMPTDTGKYIIRIYTSLTGDEDLSNDTLTSQIIVKNIERDAASYSVDFDTVIVNQKFIPKATFINKQAEARTFLATMEITPGSYKSADTIKALANGAKKQASFAPWIPDSAGTYKVKIYASLPGDEDLSNDTLIVSITAAKPDIPEVYLLAQNYPNPFNPATVIRYGIPEPGFVELKVYNILGQEVAVLVSEQKSAGNYQAVFNASGMNLASGVYIYRIKAGSFVQTKKLMLIK